MNPTLHDEIEWPPGPERRRRRSDRPQTALEFQLDHVRRMYALDFITLADSLGMPVAHAGERRSCEWLAAYAPHLGTEAPDSPVEPVLGPLLEEIGQSPDRCVVAHSFEIDGLATTLAAVAPVWMKIGDGLHHARRGVERIITYAWH